MIDIHSHIIPCVDDGSESISMSLSMILSAYDQGIRTFFATPHSSAFDSDPVGTREQFGFLQFQVSQFFKDVSLYLGCEVMCDTYNMDHVLASLASGKYPTLNQSKYVLVEFSRWVRAEDTSPCLKKLIAAGWIPVIAHIEKYVYLVGLEDLVDRFREMGCLIQMNTYSIGDEEMNTDIKTWARNLVAAHKVDVLGTDMHRTTDHPPQIASGMEWLRRNCPASYLEAICYGNAQCLLEDSYDSI